MDKEVVELISGRKWTELLRKMTPDETVAFVFNSVKDMNSFRTVAARMNTTGQEPLKYSCSGLNYITMSLSVTATKK